MNAIVIVGPTAIGKSALGIRLAEHLGGEIVSIDSRQIYRRLDIGTAKPSRDDRRKVRHHLLDILDIDEKSNANDFSVRAQTAINDILSRDRLPVLVGGSGLYLRSVMDGLFTIDLDPMDREEFNERMCGIGTEELYSRLREIDPDSSKNIHANDRYRIVRALEVFELTGTTISEHFSKHQKERRDHDLLYLKIGLNTVRSVLHRMIGERTKEMYESGWRGEVEDILSGGYDPSCPGLQTLGYPEIIEHISGRIDRESVLERIASRTRQYAKRQLTWFRQDKEIHWLDPTECDALSESLNILDTAGSS
jgi:tRNA dimethylallyltransferase